MANETQSILQTSLSDFLVDEAVEVLGSEMDAGTEAILRRTVEAKSEVTALRKAVRSIKKGIPEGLYESINEELAEIAEDFTWKKSGRGKYVMEINDWVAGFHADIGKEPRFEGLMVGGHAELEVVYVVGKATDQQCLDDFILFLQGHDPPRKILTNVLINP